MDFAKNLLEKYGWKEGEGIGKNADGIIQPIKVDLKFDNAGLGHDRGAEFTNHWWQNVFNNAAKNVDVKHTDDNVSMSLKSGESVEITTKNYSITDLKKNKKDKSKNGYGSFIKSSVTLNNEKETSNKVTEDVPAKSVFKQDFSSTSFATHLSDEALFKACGGRTAHKGARHGLSLNGKLSRIEEQERQLLLELAPKFTSSTATEVFKDWVVNDSKKKQRKQKNNKNLPPTPSVEGLNDPSDPLKLIGLINEDDYKGRKKSKKSSRRQKRELEQLAETLGNLNASSTTTTISLREVSPIDSKLRGIHSNSTVIKKKKKSKNAKRRQREMEHIGTPADEDVVLDTSQAIEESNEIRSQYLKSSSTKICEGNDVESTKEIKVKRPKDKSKKRKREVEVIPELSDDDDIDLKHGTLAEQITNEIKKRPNKKIKVVVENITPFQSKHLAKAGITFVEKKEKGNGAQKKKEQRMFAKIAKKMKKSMSLEEDGDE